MIIKEIKSTSGFIFKKEKLVVVSDLGKINLEIKLNSDVVKELSSRLKDFSVNNISDFEKLSEIIGNIVPEYGKEIELAILNSLPNAWKLIDDESRQVPRPMILVLKKNVGIKEFYVTSFNSNNFDGVINAGKEVSNLIITKLTGKDKDKIDDEEILLIVKEAADVVFKDIDFELRIGVNFDNYSDTKYNYCNNKQLNEDEQFEFVRKLIGSYDLAYLENPFFEENLESYKKISDEFMHKCLICLNSKINECSKGLDMKAFNAVVLHYENFKQFKVKANELVEENIKLLILGEKGLVNIMAGFKMPIVKLNGINDNEVSKKLFEIAEEMRQGSEK